MRPGAGDTRAPHALLAGLALAACSTAIPLSPQLEEIEPDSVSPLPRPAGPVEVRGRYSYEGERELYVPGPGNVVAKVDEFTTTLVTGVRRRLQEQGFSLDAESAHVCEVQVVRVSVHPYPHFTCVIDFTVAFDPVRERGLQSRARRWSPEAACNAALTRAVVDLLSDAWTRDQLRAPR